MNSRYTNLFRFFFAMVDLGFLNCLHIALIFSLSRIWGINDQAYLVYFAFTNMAWLGCAYITGIYINDRLLHFMNYAKRSIKAFIIYVIVILIFIFFYHFDYSRLFIVLNVGGFGIILLVSRILFILGGDYIRERRRFNKRVVVVGYNELSKKLVNYFNLDNERVLMEGYFENYNAVHELSLYPILGKVRDVVDYAIQNKINEIYSTISPESNSIIYELANMAERNLIHFKFVPDFHSFVNRNVYLDYVQEIPILSLRPEPLEDIAARIKKRFFDIVFSCLVILFILSWILPLPGNAGGWD